MGGGDDQTGELFTYMDFEALRRGCWHLSNEALTTLEREFAVLFPPIGRPSIQPEKVLRSMLLQAFYSIRSKRLLMEWLQCRS